MHQRPIAPLVDALRMIGASVEYLGVTDGSPLRIQGKELEGGVTFLDASLSSQFLSALLMVAPVMRKGLTIQLSENSVSMPYVDMTLSLMNVLGVNAEREHFCIRTRPQVYRPVPVEVEPDWSSASFWFAMAAVSPECKLLIKDLTKRSIQGDAVVRMIFNRLGVRSLFSTEGILLEKSTAEEEFLDLDMAGTPDLVIPFTLACAGLGRKAVIRKIGHLALKESNRLEALKEEMAKLNIRICISGSDTMLIDPSGGVHSPVQPLDPHGDHRLAMAFASLAILFGPVTILDPGVVAKSYPDFWNHLAQVGFELQFTS
jgi:3-phosphoshikimate 1-carboxyvinyltransferase